MNEIILEFLADLQPAFAVLAGGLVGYLSSFILWRRTREDQRKERMASYIRKAIELSLRSGNYLRALIYAKKGGVEEVGKLGPDPMDELMALTTLHLPDVGLIVQEMHFIIQDAFGLDMGAPNAPDYLLGELAPAYVELMNKLNRALTAIAEREKLEKPSTKEQIEQWETAVAKLAKKYHRH